MKEAGANSSPVLTPPPIFSQRDVVKFVLLPQILPRIGSLVGSGFGSLPYLLAVMFNTLRILPNNHPALRRSNIGRYSFFQVVAQASSHITYDWKNADKVTIFFMIIAGFILFLLQGLLLILALVAMPAYAYNGPGPGPRTTGAFFDNTNASEDIAFRLLDLVFGIPGIFNSKNATATPFHEGLHALFAFYSYGVMLVGVFVIIYLTIAIVLETAQSGIPFGQRFEKAWAPIRLIMFFGLLLPVGGQGLGINLGQYFLLNAAKFGSNMATNAWMTFDRTTKAPYVDKAENLVALPNTPRIDNFATFMAVARICSWAEGRVNGRDIKPYWVHGAGASNSQDLENAPSFEDMVNETNGGRLVFRFGVKDQDLYASEAGAVYPYCGELTMDITDRDQPGSAYMQQAYVEMIGCAWKGTSNAGSGNTFPCHLPNTLDDMGRDYTSRYGRVTPYQPFPNMDPYVNDTSKTQILMMLNQGVSEALEQAVQRQRTESDWANTPASKYGWAGAGIWFNRIAEQNGAFAAAVYNVPSVSRMPSVMEFVKNEKRKQESSTPLRDTFTPVLASGKMIQFDTPQSLDIARILNQQFVYWAAPNSLSYFKEVAETTKGTTGNVLIDTINAFLGTRGLFDMCKNTNIHPLAQLATIGKGLLDHAIRGFGMALGLSAGSGILQLLDAGNFSQSLKSASSMFLSFATIGLAGGFLMYYVLPFLPFIYFFFAVMTWVKSIFEAMVGIPLWALAHLRIDGTGMPGESAEAGYFYILEIFLRPICIIIAFLGAILIFTAMVKVLNQIFYLVISNLSGHELGVAKGSCFNPPGTDSGGPTELDYKRGPIDEFFYTLMYAVIVYLMALPCFKLVDLIPDRIMRWLGSGVRSFGAGDGDPAEGLMSNVSGGISIMSGQAGNLAPYLGLR